MSLYPPSDIHAVTVPADDGRGCGVTHARPAGPDGQPIHPWALTCSVCEQHLLATDPRFARTIPEISLTYDEAKTQEQLAVRGSADRDSLMLAALTRLAGLELPAGAARPLPAGAPVTAMLACPRGTRSLPGTSSAVTAASPCAPPCPPPRSEPRHDDDHRPGPPVLC